MEQRFHLFVRRLAQTGYAVSVVTHPFLAAFSDDVDAAREDIATVAARLLARDAYEVVGNTFWKGLRLRRVDLTVRAVQHRRLLNVPMRITALTHPLFPDDDERPSRRGVQPIVVRIPRLGFVGELDVPDDLQAYVEEVVRHHLFMVPIEQVLDLAYEGEESVETLIVSYKPHVAKKKRAEFETRERARDLPPESMAESSRRLNDLVPTGTLDRAYRRAREIEQLTEILTASRKASVILVGETGVGKTALVHEIVQRFQGKDAPASHKNIEVYSTSGARIIAGMRYLGQWQARVQRMIDTLRVRNAILHIESLTEFLTTGDPGSGLDAARYLMPSVEAGDITVVCEATPEDLVRAERSHAAFVQAMRVIRIEPLSGEAAMAALTQVAMSLGRERDVRFTEEALTRAMDLTERFGDGSALPGSAVQLLRAAAHAEGAGTFDTREKPLGLSAIRGTATRKTTRIITSVDVTRAFALKTGYPRELVDPSVALDPDAVLEKLSARVVGQERAMVLLRDLIVSLKTAMTDPNRPLGSFLMLGPTGVGKTESALALAEYLFGDSKRMARFDMSEYAAPGSGMRLVSQYGGAEGPLARRVREQPFGIVLLDEIEKADGSVHDLLLQILGEGRLTDATGRTVSFRNTIVMLTSNLGASEANRAVGFGSGTARDAVTHYVGAAAAFFRPELLNRFDHVVPYAPLAHATVVVIARRAVEKALAREGITRRGVKIECGDAVIESIASLGFDARYGARPLHRAIEHHIVAPIARLLAATSDAPPAVIRVVCEGDAIVVRAEGARERGDEVSA